MNINTLLILVILLFFVIVLQLILIIKIWRKTGDMQKKYETKDRPFLLGDSLIRPSDGKQLFINEIRGDKYICGIYYSYGLQGENTIGGELNLKTN
jgi:hypothetical protein